jgi:hypothetical protein
LNECAENRVELDLLISREAGVVEDDDEDDDVEEEADEGEEDAGVGDEEPSAWDEIISELKMITNDMTEVTYAVNNERLMLPVSTETVKSARRVSLEA